MHLIPAMKPAADPLDSSALQFQSKHEPSLQTPLFVLILRFCGVWERLLILFCASEWEGWTEVQTQIQDYVINKVT